MNGKQNRKGGDKTMKSLLMIVATVVLAIVIGGCATKGDLAQVQAQEKLIGSKADQASQDAQAAKVAADQATLKANEAAARAEDAVKRAEERERIADERAARADTAFQRSMRK
ncbi:MAG TPA: Lpp/OprI family alanine-zipper lipoprotein [Syntrophorhabdaceae bacterium]|nr:Lpp/OprI family alanine-zipper lipoprotein [Syntrophorhabdaceae bacterium]